MKNWKEKSDDVVVVYFKLSKGHFFGGTEGNGEEDFGQDSGCPSRDSKPAAW
jgi:hypothetical protein